MEDIVKKFADGAPWQVLFALAAFYVTTKYAPDLFKFIEEYLPRKRKIARLAQELEVYRKSLELVDLAEKHGIKLNEKSRASLEESMNKIFVDFKSLNSYKVKKNAFEEFQGGKNELIKKGEFPKILFFKGTVGALIPAIMLLFIIFNHIMSGISFGWIHVFITGATLLMCLVEGGGSAYKYWWKDEEPPDSSRYFKEPFLVSFVGNGVVAAIFSLWAIFSK